MGSRHGIFAVECVDRNAAEITGLVRNGLGAGPAAERPSPELYPLGAKALT